MRKTIRNVTRRFVLQVGFSCNARCTFCYYQKSLQEGTIRDFTREEVKVKLREGRRLGKNQVDISGGEPTIRKDILEILSYAKKIGYKKICLITNGIRIADGEFCNKLIQAGMNDILLSIHSPIEKEHDSLTRVPGSYKKIINSLKNVSKYNIEVRINMTVTDINYKSAGKLLKLVKPYRPAAVNFLVFNPSQESCSEYNEDTVIVDYKVITEELKKAIEKYEKYFQVINVRWIPFCFLRGHEEKIRTMWQKMYEDQEWDPYLNIKYNKGIFAVIASFAAGLFLYPFRAPIYGKRNLYTFFNEVLTTFRGVYFYRHQKGCKKCSLKKICPGLPVNYVKRFNKTKVEPYKPGRIVKDPLYFCKAFKGQFESLRLNS